jgi:hypothetical protein
MTHDPNDLREAAKLVRKAGRDESLACQPTEELADRLEAWAHDMERPRSTTDLVSALRFVARAAESQSWPADMIPSMERYVRIVRAATDDMERLAPLAAVEAASAAVLDAAKKLRDAIWKSGDLRNPANGEADLVAVWNKCTVMSARLADLDAAADALAALKEAQQ